jgi:hypothetical protein
MVPYTASRMEGFDGASFREGSSCAVRCGVSVGVEPGGTHVVRAVFTSSVMV